MKDDVRLIDFLNGEENMSLKAYLNAVEKADETDEEYEEAEKEWLSYYNDTRL